MSKSDNTTDPFADLLEPGWPDAVIIDCFGCDTEFEDLRTYRRHRCPEPASGEAYRRVTDDTDTQQP